MSYHEYFCLPILEKNLDAYVADATIYATVMQEHGMLQYSESVAENVPRGTHTDFYRAVDAQEGETVVVGHAVWPDRATRDKAWEVAAEDPRMKSPEGQSFDGKRMFWGVFRPILER